MSSDSGEEEEEEPYPPWLQIVLDEDSTYWDEVVVMREGIDGGKDKEWTEVKHIVVPDTTEAASGKGAGECRTFHIKRFVTILIASEPTSAPYIGLVDKVFRRRGAKKLREVQGKPVYRLGDFGVQAYWFYRPTEVPPTAWRKHTKLQQGSEGQAMYRLPGGKKLDMEDVSERQVLFSSHHTLHDYPEQQGILAMDGFLQACKVHWLGASAAELPRYEVHGSKLMAVQEPGFVVRGFLWCAAKDEPQLDARFKEVHRLETCKWPDKETCAIVQHCMKEYQDKTRKALLERNRAVLTRFHAAKAAGREDIPSDEDSDDDPAAGAPGSGTHSRPSSAAKPSPSKAAAAAGGGGSRAAPAQVSSPRLEGVDDDAAAAAAAAADLEDDDDLGLAPHLGALESD